MDAFSSLIDDNNMDISFQGLNLQGINYNHLLYPNDLIIFGKADSENIMLLNDIFSFFYKCYGLKVL